MLVIDRVVLKRVEQRDQIVRFGNEDATRFEQLDDAVDDGMHVLHMCEAVGGRHDTGGSVLAPDLTRCVQSEVAFDRRDTALVGNVADVRRLDPEHALTAIFEIRQ